MQPSRPPPGAFEWTMLTLSLASLFLGIRTHQALKGRR